MPSADEESRELPFRAVVRPETEEAPPIASDDSDDMLALSEEFSGDDLEAAYLRAFEAVESILDETAPALEPDGDAVEVPPDELADPLTSSTPPPNASPPEAEAAPSTPAASPAVSSRQVVEALLFVGGAALTTRKISEILGEGFSSEQIEEIVEGLNEEYAAENRPYAIHWGEGGYRYQLRTEFEKVRNRVFGVGPKEVKLSQEALEVLALVAYRQPLRSADLESTERKNAGSLLRQLIRRELVELRRSETAPDDPTYHTTPRFLELFGLTSLDDLPFPADFAFK